METEKNFEIQPNIQIADIYKMLGAHTPLEMSNLYTEEDQKLMKSGQWDYDNHELITNKIKELLERIDESGLTEEELEWKNEILWFWYHHAISCAIGKNDQDAAKEYADKALELQSEDHPNKITKLLHLLVHDRLKEAEVWASSITKEPEKSTAQYQLEIYKNQGYFH